MEDTATLKNTQEATYFSPTVMMFSPSSNVEAMLTSLFLLLEVFSAWLCIQYLMLKVVVGLPAHVFVRLEMDSGTK